MILTAEMIAEAERIAEAVKRAAAAVTGGDRKAAEAERKAKAERWAELSRKLEEREAERKAEREKAWEEAERNWEALPEAEKIKGIAEAEAELKKTEGKKVRVPELDGAPGLELSDSVVVIGHWSFLTATLKTGGTLITGLRKIRNSCIAGHCTKKAALALFDTRLTDIKKDGRRKIYKSWAECGETPSSLTQNQLCWVFSRTAAIDSGSEVIAEIRAEIEGLPEPAPDTRADGAAAVPPPVIKAVLDEGLLDATPVNGKYHKIGGKRDGDIIRWIFNYSGYEDSLTTELYMRHIQTTCKSTTISDYIKRAKDEAR